MKLFLSSYLLTTALTKSFLVSAVCFSNNMNKLLFLTMFSTLSAAEKTSFVSSKVKGTVNLVVYDNGYGADKTFITVDEANGKSYFGDARVGAIPTKTEIEVYGLQVANDKIVAVTTVTANTGCTGTSATPLSTTQLLLVWNCLRKLAWMKICLHGQLVPLRLGSYA